MIRVANKTVMIAVPVSQGCSLKIAPALHHSCQIRRTLRIECRIETHGKLKCARRCRKVRSWSYERHPVEKKISQWNVIPFADLLRIQMIDRAQAEQLVQPRYDAAILQVGKPADVNDEFRTAVALRQFIARLLDIAIGQSQPFSNLAKTGPRKQIC